MDIDDLDIYNDLDEFQRQEEKKSAEFLALEAKYKESLEEIEQMKKEEKILRKKVRIMQTNFQILLDTAKAEIKRKDTRITELQREKDDICFRRNVRSKVAAVDSKPYKPEPEHNGIYEGAPEETGGSGDMHEPPNPSEYHPAYVPKQQVDYVSQKPVTMTTPYPNHNLQYETIIASPTEKTEEDKHSKRERSNAGDAAAAFSASQKNSIYKLHSTTKTARHEYPLEGNERYSRDPRNYRAGSTHSIYEKRATMGVEEDHRAHNRRDHSRGRRNSSFENCDNAENYTDRPCSPDNYEDPRINGYYNESHKQYSDNAQYNENRNGGYSPGRIYGRNDDYRQDKNREDKRAKYERRKSYEDHRDESYMRFSNHRHRKIDREIGRYARNEKYNDKSRQEANIKIPKKESLSESSTESNYKYERYDNDNEVKSHKRSTVGTNKNDSYAKEKEKRNSAKEKQKDIKNKKIQEYTGKPTDAGEIKETLKKSDLENLSDISEEETFIPEIDFSEKEKVEDKDQIRIKEGKDKRSVDKFSEKEKVEDKDQIRIKEGKDRRSVDKFSEKEKVEDKDQIRIKEDKDKRSVDKIEDKDQIRIKEGKDKRSVDKFSEKEKVEDKDQIRIKEDKDKRSVDKFSEKEKVEDKDQIRMKEDKDKRSVDKFSEKEKVEDKDQIRIKEDKDKRSVDKVEDKDQIRIKEGKDKRSVDKFSEKEKVEDKDQIRIKEDKDKRSVDKFSEKEKVKDKDQIRMKEDKDKRSVDKFSEKEKVEDKDQIRIEEDNDKRSVDNTNLHYIKGEFNNTKVDKTDTTTDKASEAQKCANIDTLSSEAFSPPKRLALFDALFGASPCAKQSDDDGNKLLNNVLQFLNSDSASTSPDAYSDTNECQDVETKDNGQKWESNGEDYFTAIEKTDDETIQGDELRKADKLLKFKAEKKLEQTIISNRRDLAGELGDNEIIEIDDDSDADDTDEEIVFRRVNGHIKNKQNEKAKSSPEDCSRDIKINKSKKPLIEIIENIRLPAMLPIKEILETQSGNCEGKPSFTKIDFLAENEKDGLECGTSHGINNYTESQATNNKTTVSDKQVKLFNHDDEGVKMNNDLEDSQKIIAYEMEEQIGFSDDDYENDDDEGYDCRYEEGKKMDYMISAKDVPDQSLSVNKCAETVFSETQVEVNLAFTKLSGTNEQPFVGNRSKADTEEIALISTEETSANKNSLEENGNVSLSSNEEHIYISSQRENQIKCVNEFNSQVHITTNVFEKYESPKTGSQLYHKPLEEDKPCTSKQSLIDSHKRNAAKDLTDEIILGHYSFDSSFQSTYDPEVDDDIYDDLTNFALIEKALIDDINKNIVNRNKNRISDKQIRRSITRNDYVNEQYDILNIKKVDVEKNNNDISEMVSPTNEIVIQNKNNPSKITGNDGTAKENTFENKQFGNIDIITKRQGTVLSAESNVGTEMVAQRDKSEMNETADFNGEDDESDTESSESDLETVIEVQNGEELVPLPEDVSKTTRSDEYGSNKINNIDDNNKMEQDFTQFEVIGKLQSVLNENHNEGFCKHEEPCENKELCEILEAVFSPSLDEHYSAKSAENFKSKSVKTDEQTELDKKLVFTAEGKENNIQYKSETAKKQHNLPIFSFEGEENSPQNKYDPPHIGRSDTTSGILNPVDEIKVSSQKSSKGTTIRIKGSSIEDDMEFINSIKMKHKAKNVKTDTSVPQSKLAKNMERSENVKIGKGVKIKDNGTQEKVFFKIPKRGSSTQQYVPAKPLTDFKTSHQTRLNKIKKHTDTLKEDKESTQAKVSSKFQQPARCESKRKLDELKSSNNATKLKAKGRKRKFSEEESQSISKTEKIPRLNGDEKWYIVPSSVKATSTAQKESKKATTRSHKDRMGTTTKKKIKAGGETSAQDEIIESYDIDKAKTEHRITSHVKKGSQEELTVIRKESAVTTKKKKIKDKSTKNVDIEERNSRKKGKNKNDNVSGKVDYEELKTGSINLRIKTPHKTRASKLKQRQAKHVRRILDSSESGDEADDVNAKSAVDYHSNNISSDVIHSTGSSLSSPNELKKNSQERSEHSKKVKHERDIISQEQIAAYKTSVCSSEAQATTKINAPPTPDHAIFHNEPSRLQANLSVLPICSIPQDAQYTAIDSRMQSMFHSPPYAAATPQAGTPIADSLYSPIHVPQNLSPPPPAEDTVTESKSSLTSCQNSTFSTVDVALTCNLSATIDETLLESSTLTEQSSALQNTSSEIKFLTIGNSEYRIEKLSEHVSKVFITRKRRKKK